LPKKSRHESLKQKLEAIVVRIPITPTTVTAALLLVQQVIELARVVKVPLQVEKVATLEVTAPPGPPIGIPMPVTEPVKEAEK
jgi:hypothetical protein